ncbi:ankyrin repeat protein [Moumouvirus australiensis]|uniref:Ankyrin repeat protein n=1 Tax=Moumouvirus australiensis TaxID=2109587 RepID=A0A2P1EMV6_9VIRU|nr:ankyrin repeat protein [Moumouvirus australiensis]AVL95213.1 ankyrin repeat protein [Moumouvirus australiensis]
MTRNKKSRKNNIPKNSPLDGILNDEPCENISLNKILESDIFEDTILEFNGRSFPVYNRSFEEFRMIYEQITSTPEKKLHQRDYLFLIYHKDLYNGKLHKIQIINYIKKHLITRYEFDRIGMTQLMCMCIYSQNDTNLELVKMFTNGYNINFKDDLGRTALAYSLKNPGNVKIIRFLLDYLQKINPFNYLQIINEALIYWSKTDYLPDIKMAEILINAGASVNFKDSFDSNVLINIINNKNYKDISNLVKFLFEKGVNIYTSTKIKPTCDISKNKYLGINFYDKIRWSTNIGKKMVKSIGNEDVTIDNEYAEPQYDLIDHLIERHKRDGNLKNISLLYDFGYRELPKTENKIIINFTQNIIDDIDFRESYFRKFGKDLIEKRNEITYKPGSLRFEIINSNWNKNFGGSSDNKIIKFFGINDKMELEKIIYNIYSENY